MTKEEIERKKNSALERINEEYYDRDTPLSYIKNELKWPIDGTSETNDMLRLFDWMKQAASVVIAKERERYDKLESKNNDIFMEYRKKLEQKDKEIEGLKDALSYYRNPLGTINTNQH